MNLRTPLSGYSEANYSTADQIRHIRTIELLRCSAIESSPSRPGLFPCRLGLCSDQCQLLALHNPSAMILFNVHNGGYQKTRQSRSSTQHTSYQVPHLKA